jgi:hypothetical protein
MMLLQYLLFIISINPVYLYIQNQGKPICANCKFFIPNKNECSKFGNVNIITGKHNYDNAVDMRNNEDKCGKYAIFFEKNYFKFITVPYFFALDNSAFTLALSLYGLSYGIIFYLLFKWTY